MGDVNISQDAIEDFTIPMRWNPGWMAPGTTHHDAAVIPSPPARPSVEASNSSHSSEDVLHRLCLGYPLSKLLSI